MYVHRIFAEGGKLDRQILLCANVGTKLMGRNECMLKMSATILGYASAQFVICEQEVIESIMNGCLKNVD